MKLLTQEEYEAIKTRGDNLMDVMRYADELALRGHIEALEQNNQKLGEALNKLVRSAAELVASSRSLIIFKGCVEDWQLSNLEGARDRTAVLLRTMAIPNLMISPCKGNCKEVQVLRGTIKALEQERIQLLQHYRDFLKDALQTLDGREIKEP